MYINILRSLGANHGALRVIKEIEAHTESQREKLMQDRFLALCALNKRFGVSLDLFFQGHFAFLHPHKHEGPCGLLVFAWMRLLTDQPKNADALVWTLKLWCCSDVLDQVMGRFVEQLAAYHRFFNSRIFLRSKRSQEAKLDQEVAYRLFPSCRWSLKEATDIHRQYNEERQFYCSVMRAVISELSSDRFAMLAVNFSNQDQQHAIGFAVYQGKLVMFDGNRGMFSLMPMPGAGKNAIEHCAAWYGEYMRIVYQDFRFSTALIEPFNVVQKQEVELSVCASRGFAAGC